MSRRILLVMMLLLGLVLQPLVAAYGEMHEALAHAGEAHAIEVVDAAGDDAGPSHALSHHAHCCAQPQVFPPGALTLPAPIAVATPVEGFGVDTHPDARKGTPFRPPILA